jgi:caspase domain-containing protein
MHRCIGRKAVVGFVITCLLTLQCTLANAQDAAEIHVGSLKGKFALVIGNGAYKNGPLSNPTNDAKDVAASLRAIGFDVTLALDLELKVMRVTIAKFAGKLTDNSAALLFYAGHGVQFAGTNYLLPIGSLSKIKEPRDLEAHSVSLSDLISQITARKNAVSIFILDACRDSPFTSVPEIISGLARTVPRGLARSDDERRIKASRLAGVLIAYSTAPNMVALDGVGRNSPYTKHLKDALRRPNTTLESMLKLTGSGVTIETAGGQTPWYESSINGDFYPAGRGRIDFEELLRLFIPVPDRDPPILNAYYSYDWIIGSTEFSPIQWAYEGVRFADNNNVVRDFKGEEWGSFVREGTIVITVDGAPTHHVLLRQKVPGQWHIAMTGFRSGFHGVSFTNDALTFDFTGFEGSPLLKEDPTCRTGESKSGTKVFSVSIPGRIPAWLAEEWSCGTGGCNYQYRLFYNRQDRSRFNCGG